MLRVVFTQKFPVKGCKVSSLFSSKFFTVRINPTLDALYIRGSQSSGARSQLLEILLPWSIRTLLK
jgi:hypothetical protein